MGEPGHLTPAGAPLTRRYVAPPNWPQPPEGWSPPEGWHPPTAWGPPPPGWDFWVDDEEPREDGGAAPTPKPAIEEPKVSRFGARRQARELAAEVAELRGHLQELGALDVAQLRQRRAELRLEIEHEEDRFRTRAAEFRREAERTKSALASEIASMQKERDRLRDEIIETEDIAVLQEAGIYQARHPLNDSTAYKAELARLQDSIKAMTRKDGGAVEAAKGWTVDGSAAKGRTMTNEYSKLVLRAYNAEADNLVRDLKPYKLRTSVERLNKVSQTIERLGRTMSIRISPAYHRLRVKELELTADYRDKQAEEKEREREERERLREERKAQQELETERRRLEKEQQHYQNVLATLLAKGDAEGAERLRAHLDDIERALQDVDYRAANVRAGYVYVISNIGAFGSQMVKIGMTRRLEPMDRVRELGDASVPFRFDVHALFFSQDAVGIENAMHRRFETQRVNKINTRREFFYISPGQARDALSELAGDLLSFTELADAPEFRQSGGRPSVSSDAEGDPPER